MDIITPQQNNQPKAPQQLEPHHATPTLKILLLIFSILIVGLLGYIVYQQNYTVDSTDYSTKSSTDNSWKNYTNTTHKFSLTFTDAFKGYEVKPITTASGATALYYFNLKTSDANYQKAGNTNSAGYYEAFVIGVYSTSQWAALSSIAKDNQLTIGSSSEYVFVYNIPQDGPSDLAKVDIRPVIASFRITSPSSVSTANWKTYTNTASKLSLKYPSDWSYGDANTGVRCGESSVVCLGPASLTTDRAMGIDLYPNSTVAKVESQLKEDMASSSTYISTESVKINNETYTKVTFQNKINAGLNPSWYLISKPSGVFKISNNTATIVHEEKLIINAIIESIDFTD